MFFSVSIVYKLYNKCRKKTLMSKQKKYLLLCDRTSLLTFHSKKPLAQCTRPVLQILPIKHKTYYKIIEAQLCLNSKSSKKQLSTFEMTEHQCFNFKRTVSLKPLKR